MIIVNKEYDTVKDAYTLCISIRSNIFMSALQLKGRAFYRNLLAQISCNRSGGGEDDNITDIASILCPKGKIQIASHARFIYPWILIYVQLQFTMEKTFYISYFYCSYLLKGKIVYIFTQSAKNCLYNYHYFVLLVKLFIFQIVSWLSINQQAHHATSYYAVTYNVISKNLM